MKEKISGLGVNDSILKGVSKGLDNKIKTIQREIRQNALQIQDTSKDISEYLINKNEKRLDQEKINRLNQLKGLKTRENDIRHNLNQLTQNQKMLETEGYANISQTNSSIAHIDENIRRDQIKEIKQSRDTLTQKLEQINLQIKNLIFEENKDSNNKKVNIQSFLDNFERDKELIEIRAKKYEQESRTRRQRMRKDITQLTVEMMSKIEREEKEAIEQKMLRLQEMKMKEKEQIKKRTTDNNQKLLKIKVFINEKPKDVEYFYKEKMKEYNSQEEKRIQTEANKRKAMMRSISKEECDEFALKFNDNKIKTKEELEEKSSQLNELWRERKELLPQYISPFLANVISVIEDEKKEKEEKEIEMIAHKKIKKEFGEEVKAKFKPPISRKLQRERRDRIMRLKRNKKLIEEDKKKMRNKKKLMQKKKRVILRKRDLTKPSKCKWKLKLNISDFSNQNVPAVKKPKRIAFSNSADKKKRVIPDKPIDYLVEEKKKREMKTELLKKSGQLIHDSSKWSKMLSGNNKRSLFENINQVKLKAEILEIEAKQKEQFLKLNGGSERYPEIGEKVSNLLIDSIKAKLSILNSVTNTK